MKLKNITIFTFILFSLSIHAGEAFYKMCTGDITEREKETISSIKKKYGLTDCREIQLKLDSETTFHSNWNLRGWKINTLKPFSDLVKLERISVSGDLESLDHIEKLINLKELTIKKANLKSLKGLENLSKLNSLYIENFKRGTGGIKNLRPIAHLINLQYLSLVNQNVVDITALMGLSNLLNLNLTGSDNIKNISAIRYLSMLRGFVMACEYEDKSKCKKDIYQQFSRFFNLKFIETFIMPYAGIEDFSFLSHSKVLKVLDITGNPTKDLSFLIPGRHDQIYGLFISGTNIEDFSFLKKYKIIDELKADKTSFSDLSILKGVGVKKLSCVGCRIKDVGPLNNLSKHSTYLLQENLIETLANFPPDPVMVLLRGNPVLDDPTKETCPLDHASMTVSRSCRLALCRKKNIDPDSEACMNVSYE